MNKIDIKYLGIPNICFSFTGKDDKREKLFIQQRVENGFDDSETWALFLTIANFIIPRLKKYIEITKDYFADSEEPFKGNCKKVLLAMELLARERGLRIFTKEEQKQVTEGLKLFGEIFEGLWW